MVAAVREQLGPVDLLVNNAGIGSRGLSVADTDPEEPDRLWRTHAFGAWALYGRRRRFYTEHLVFAFYIFAFLMLWMGISTLTLTKPVLSGKYRIFQCNPVSSSALAQFEGRGRKDEG